MSSEEDAIDRMILPSVTRAAMQTQKENMSPEFQTTLMNFTKTMKNLEREFKEEKRTSQLLYEKNERLQKTLYVIEHYWWFKLLYPIQQWFDARRAKKQLTIQKR